jgi:hypothetical protein
LILILLPLIAFALFYLIFRKSESDRRVAVLAAAFVWGVCVEAITEALSPFRLIGRGAPAIRWLAVFVATLFILRRTTGIANERAETA